MKTTLANASTTTEPARVERITIKHATELIVAESDLHSLPFPYALGKTGPDTAILRLQFRVVEHMHAWGDYFGVTAWTGVGHTVYEQAPNWHGWTVELSAYGPATIGCTCGGEVVHQTGCPAEPAQCPATWYDGWCPGEVRHDDGRCDTHTSHNLTYDAPVSPEGVPEHLADHFAVLNPYVPVPKPTGVQANRDEAARLKGQTGHHLPTGVHPPGHEPTWQSGHPQRDPVRIVDVTTIPELPTGNDAAISRTGRQPYASDQHLYAEAPDWLQTVRDNDTFAEIVEASE